MNISHLSRFLRKLGAAALEVLGVTVVIVLASAVMTVGCIGLVYGLGYLVNLFVPFKGETEFDAIMNAGTAVFLVGVVAAFPIWALTIAVRYLINLWKETKNS